MTSKALFIIVAESTEIFVPWRNWDAHRPGRGDLRQGLWRTGTERAARSGEQNAVHPLGPTRGIFRQALKNG